MTQSGRSSVGALSAMQLRLFPGRTGFPKSFVGWPSADLANAMRGDPLILICNLGLTGSVAGDVVASFVMLLCQADERRSL